MTDILDKIIAVKREEITAVIKQKPLALLRADAESRMPHAAGQRVPKLRVCPPLTANATPPYSQVQPDSQTCYLTSTPWPCLFAPPNCAA